MVARSVSGKKNATARAGRAGAKAGARKPVGHVAIVGAGRMGADIALAFLAGGWRCDVVEADPKVVARARSFWRKETRRLGLSGRTSDLTLHATTASFDWSTVDLALEAVFEDLALKHKIVRDIETRVRRRAIIATNTSSLRITDVTRVLQYPDRSAGLHFMVPAHIMPAVEVTRGKKTADATMRKLVSWMKAMEKVPIVLNRDIPGMLINRVQHAMYREIYHLIDEGIATAETVDLAVRFGFGFRYQILGPVVSRDIHGLPVHLAASAQIYPTLHNGKKPSRTLSRLVEQGHHGARTGRGFYAWDKRTTEKRLAMFSKLLEQGFSRVKRRGEPTEF